MRIASLILAVALPLPLGAASPAPTHLTIALSNFRFDPAPIRLKRGQPYVLHLVNRSGRKHNFVAPVLLRRGAAPVARQVEVPAGGSANVAIVAPAAGRYKVKCTHFTHAMRGMTDRDHRRVSLSAAGCPSIRGG